MISADTYEELYEILSLMDKETVMKVPVEVLNNIKKQRNPDYKTRIDKTDIFNKNNVNKETIDLLCYLDYNYWMDEDKKAEVDKIKEQIIKTREMECRKKYNPDDIFKKTDNKQETTDVEINVNNIKEYKENIWQKMLKLIKKLINR